MRKVMHFDCELSVLTVTIIEKTASVDTWQPSMEMAFSLCLPFRLSVSWLSLGYALPPPQGHYTVIAPAWGPTCDAIVVSAHLLACNAPMKSVMKQVGSQATFLPSSPLGRHLGVCMEATRMQIWHFGNRFLHDKLWRCFQWRTLWFSWDVS